MTPCFLLTIRKKSDNELEASFKPILQISEITCFSSLQKRNKFQFFRFWKTTQQQCKLLFLHASWGQQQHCQSPAKSSHWEDLGAQTMDVLSSSQHYAVLPVKAQLWLERRKKSQSSEPLCPGVTVPNSDASPQQFFQNSKCFQNFQNDFKFWVWKWGWGNNTQNRHKKKSYE